MKKIIISIIAVIVLIAAVPVSTLAANATEYSITYTPVEGASYTRTVSKIKSTAYKSVYVKPSSSDYYIESVNITPEGALDYKYYQNTGELFIENVTADITITPVVKLKQVPSALSVSLDFGKGGNYDEGNSTATANFTVTLTDQNGNPVADTKVYFKSDVSEVSFTKAVSTDNNGKALVKHYYSLESGVYEKEFTALFSTASNFGDGAVNAEKSLKVVQQRRRDIVLTTDQIRDSLPGENTGKVINFNPAYEYFTGALHQGAIVTDSGEWVTPENGNIEGLAPGQYALRFREYVDGSTIYLHSNFDYFTIGRANWTIKADTENSQHITFDQTETYAEPGGLVYFYIDVENGYEVTDYYVDKPSRVNDIRYNKDDGYIVLDSVTGNITLTVIATKIPPVDYTVIEGNNSQWNGESEGLTITSEASFDKFTGVLVDGELIDESNYTANEGSTKVTLSASYLSTLLAGAHTVEIRSIDGSAAAIINISKTEEIPQENAASQAKEAVQNNIASQSVEAANEKGDSQSAATSLEAEKESENKASKKSPSTGNNYSAPIAAALITAGAVLLTLRKKLD